MLYVRSAAVIRRVPICGFRAFLEMIISHFFVLWQAATIASRASKLRLASCGIASVPPPRHQHPWCFHSHGNGTCGYNVYSRLLTFNLSFDVVSAIPVGSRLNSLKFTIKPSGFLMYIGYYGEQSGRVNSG